MSLLALIAKYGSPISKWALLYQAQNRLVNIVSVDYWIAELAIIVSNGYLDIFDCI